MKVLVLVSLDLDSFVPSRDSYRAARFLFGSFGMPLVIHDLRVFEHVAQIEVQLRPGQLVLLLEQVLALHLVILDNLDWLVDIHTHLDALYHLPRWRRRTLFTR